MLKSLHIQNFRGFRDFRMDGFGRINLIAGANNVGKTSLLEALYLNLSPTSPETTFRTDFLRGFQELSSRLEVAGSWGWLFYLKQFQQPIQIATESDIDNAKLRRLTIKWPQLIPALGGMRPLSQSLQLLLRLDETDDIAARATVEMSQGNGRYAALNEWERFAKFQAVFAAPLGALLGHRKTSQQENAEWFSDLDDWGRGHEVVQVLQILDRRLQGLALSMSDKVPMVYVDIGIGRRVPLAQMGEGMVNLFAMLLEIANAPGGVVLIDDIESGLHHSVMIKVWRALAEAARKSNAQIFATTHSIETIRAAHIALQASGVYDLQLYRLERNGADAQAIVYTEDTLEMSVARNWEVR